MGKARRCGIPIHREGLVPKSGLPLIRAKQLLFKKDPLDHAQDDNREGNALYDFNRLWTENYGPWTNLMLNAMPQA